MNTHSIEIDFLADFGSVQLARATAYSDYCRDLPGSCIASVNVVCCREQNTAIVLASPQLGGVELLDGIDDMIGSYGTMDDRTWAETAARLAVRKYLSWVKWEMPAPARAPNQVRRFLAAVR